MPGLATARTTMPVCTLAMSVRPQTTGSQPEISAEDCLRTVRAGQLPRPHYVRSLLIGAEAALGLLERTYHGAP